MIASPRLKVIVLILALTLLTGCNLPLVNSGDSTPDSATAAPDDTTGDDSGPEPDDSTPAPADDDSPADQPVIDEMPTPRIVVQSSDKFNMFILDPTTGETITRFDDPPRLFSRDYINQLALDANTFIAPIEANTGEAAIYRISGDTAEPFPFTIVGEEQAQSLGAAIWPGTGDQSPLLAWSTLTFSQEAATATLRIAPISGSSEITTVTQFTNETRGYVVPVRWSLDGQRLYFSEQPSGFGAVGANYFGFTNLRYYDRASGSTVTVLSENVFPQAVCLDDLSWNEKLIAHHCGGAIGILDLERGLLNTTVISPDVRENARVIGSARFNPDATRVAFAMTRGDLAGEQSWVAVTDDLSGRSRLLMTGDPGYFLNVLGWLDDETLVVNALNGEINTERSPIVWLVTTGGETRQLTEGTALTMLNPRIVDSPIAPPQVADRPGSGTGDSGSDDQPDDRPTPSPTPQPVPESPDPAPTGDLIYETDFRTIWPPITQDNATATQEANGYLINVTQFFLYAFTTQAARSEFYAEVTATPQQCPAGVGAYGLMFHFESGTRFRYAIATCTGRFALYERTASNELEQLSEGRLPDAVSPGSGPHTIGVLANNNTLTLYVDDYRVASVSTNRMPSGDIGPYVETGGSPISILYTRMAIYEP